MRYLSLFSGIESASVAWQSLGWSCAAVAEIEPFPCAVLKHRFPEVPNLGDITKITQQQIEQLGHIDVAVWGFPCQDLSLAGNRKGLNNADGSLTRSGLFFTALQISEWSKGRWLLGENVPGLFSSNEGRDFASVVGELAGIELDVPPDGWANSGVALGPKGLVEWATLDAQYCRVDSHPRAVPQRRRRVFIVRDSGTDWERRPPVFLIPESLRGNPAPSRGQRQRPPTAAAPCAGDGGPCAGTLGSRGTRSHTELDGHGAHVIETATVMAHGQAGAEIIRDGEPSLSCNHEAPILFTQEVSDPLTAHEQKTYTHEGENNFRTRNVMAFDTTQITSPGNISNPQPGDPCHPLASTAHPPAITVIQDVRGLDKKQNGAGFSEEDVAYTADAAATQGVAVAFQERGREDGRSIEMQKDLAYSLNSPGEGGRRNELNVATGTAVRRLTPTECERLQGFPDHWTKIPSKALLALAPADFEGDPNNPKHWAADGPRYKALGNSMATNVMRWLGKRLMQLEALTSKSSTPS